jgi:hypothetical protein
VFVGNPPVVHAKRGFGNYEVNLPITRLSRSSVPRNFRIAGDTATTVHESWF